ncbi:MAG: RDD family protein [Pseudomonadota bacterium]
MNSSVVPNSYIISPVWRRIAAAFYDGLIQIAIWMLVSVLYNFIFFRNELQISTLVLQTTLFPLCVVSSCIFYSYFWCSTGQTLGMQAWKIQLVGKYSNQITKTMAIKRFFIAMVFLLCGGIGFLWCYFNSQRLSAQDQLSDTRVIVK